MDYAEMVLMLSNMTVSEHKQMTKALRTLLAVGMDQFTAVGFICTAMKERERTRREQQSNSSEPVRIKR